MLFRNLTDLSQGHVFIDQTDPPDGPPSIDDKSITNELKVIQNNYVRLNCSTTGGNPLPVLQWNRNNDSPMIINGKTVTKTISWQATGQISTNLICRSFHLYRNDTIAAAVNILYPPERPTITIKTSSGVFEELNTMLSVIEGRYFTLNCSATSNPPVALFMWNDMLPSKSSTLYAAYIRRDTETISCNVSNEMQTSYSSTPQYGNNITILRVSVLCPPKMNVLRDMTIVEGDDLNYSCNFTEGNPNITNITWSRQGITWTGQQLHIRNVSRSQAGVYRCNVSNLMVSSDKMQELGRDSSEFTLSVQYKTQVLKFVANDHETDTVTVNENDEVNISCELEGDPLPTGILLRQDFTYFLSQKEEFLLNNSTLLTSTKFRLRNTSQAKCINTGLQICRGRNKLHTGEWFTSNKTISLFVNCSPRQSPSFELKQNVTSALHDTATFLFTTMSYPAPSFQWYRVINGSKTPEILGGVIRNYTITTNEMQTNFTLYDVEENHYGEYLLKIENQYGTFNQTFYLVPEELPTETLIQPGSVGPVVGGVVGGLLLIITVTVFLLIVRKCLVGSRARSPDDASKQNDSHTYQNFQNDDHLDGSSSAVYERLQHAGSEMDQQYQQLAAFVDTVKTKGADRKVYENLQLVHRNKDHVVGESSAK